jgi:hydroxyacyl-ACP dehydratase HTD2-like protein with hotdog domain
LIPDATLLFRYSALTFNAHAIHLDPDYCREIEGYKNLLVHGPLSLSLLELMLHNHIKDKVENFVEHISYKHLAPLYVGEPIKLCGRELGNSRYELWIEGPHGGLAVMATAKVGYHDPSLDRNADKRKESQD